MTSEAQWQVRANGRLFGPVSAAELKRLAADGKLAPTMEVKRDSDLQWYQASQIQGLTFPAQTPAVVQSLSVHNSSHVIVPVPQTVPARNDDGHRLLIAIAITAVVCLTIGYFAGREHLRYQLQDMIAQVGKNFAEGLREGRDANPFVDETQDSAAVERDSAAVERADESRDPSQYGVGDRYVTEHFSFSISKVEIMRPHVYSISGDMAEGESPQLVVTFDIRNTSERKLLRFYDGGYGHPTFTLRDDADNVLRRIGFGTGSRVVGALDEDDDIQPNQQVTHVEVFQKPPDKTIHLKLLVSTAFLGGNEFVRFDIPVDEVEGF